MTTAVPMVKGPRAKRKLGEQITEVRRELHMRSSAYPRFVQAGKLTQKAADYQTECLEDALASLQWLAHNRSACLAWLAAQNGADTATGEFAGGVANSSRAFIA